MKILQVNVVYAKGSTGKIVADIHHELLNDGFESVVCFGRGQAPSEKFIYKTCGELYSHFNHLLTKLSGVMYGGCFFSTNRLIHIIKKERPDIVHLHCLNGYFVNIYRLIKWLKKTNINTVLTLHAEFMYTGGCGHAFDCEKWKNDKCIGCEHWKKETGSVFLNRTRDMWNMLYKAFFGMSNIIVTAVSPWLTNRAKQSPILSDKKHFTVLNGVDCSVFKFRKDEELRNHYIKNYTSLVFHATAFFSDEKDDIKGGCYVLKLAELNPDMVFVIAGRHCKIDNLPNNVVLLGNVGDQVLLARLYSISDITLITSRRETFSMVTAESLCCGTPVVGFKAGGPEQIGIGEYSFFCEYGDIEQLNETIKKVVGTDFIKTDIEQKAKEQYSVKNIINNYLSVYSQFYKNE